MRNISGICPSRSHNWPHFENVHSSAGPILRRKSKATSHDVEIHKERSKPLDHLISTLESIPQHFRRKKKLHDSMQAKSDWETPSWKAVKNGEYNLHMWRVRTKVHRYMRQHARNFDLWCTECRCPIMECKDQQQVNFSLPRHNWLQLHWPRDPAAMSEGNTDPI